MSLLSGSELSRRFRPDSSNISIISAGSIELDVNLAFTDTDSNASDTDIAAVEKIINDNLDETDTSRSLVGLPLVQDGQPITVRAFTQSSAEDETDIRLETTTAPLVIGNATYK